MNDQEAYYELAYYTLAHPSPDFIHQHIVDAFTAQTANEQTKSIAIYFALVGLYLRVEKQYTGKEVQQAHVTLSNCSKQFKPIELPKYRGDITIADVLAIHEGKQRDDMIDDWCISVWDAYASCRQNIIELSFLLHEK